MQDGLLFVLQVREAKRTSLAALRIAVELAEAGVSTPRVELPRDADPVAPGLLATVIEELDGERGNGAQPGRDDEFHVPTLR